MRKATLASCILVLCSALALAGFVVTPAQDPFDVLQNTSVIRTYIVQSNDTSGIIDLSTSVAWVYDTTDYLNVTPGKNYSAKVTFSPLLIPPGDYSVLVTFAAAGDIKTVKAQPRVVKTNWVYAYLLPGESYADMTFTNVSLAEGSYSLVSIKGSESFLLKNGSEIVKDVSEIRQFYEAYYLQTLFPKDSELEEVKALAKTFNESRNAMTRYGPAEKTCKQYTGMNNYPCHDSTSCILACSALIELCAPAMNAIGPSFISGLVDFGTSTTSMDGNYTALQASLNSLTISNVAANLNSAYQNANSLKSLANRLLISPLREEGSSRSCPDCFGICPKMAYNITAINFTATKLKTLYDRSLSIKNLDTKSSDLLSATNKRLSDVFGKEHKDGYVKRYEVIKPLAADIAQRVAFSNQYVDSPELEKKFAELSNATTSIEFIIDSGDYSNIPKLDSAFDSNMDRFNSSKAEVEAILLETTGLYEKIDAVRMNCSGYLVNAEMNVLPGDSAMLELSLLRKRMSETSANFTKPLRAEFAASLIESYSEITENAKRIAETKPSSSILGRIVSKIVRTEKWVALLAIGLLKPLTLPEKTAISEYVAPLTAGILALCLAAVLLFSLIVYALRNRKRLDRVRHQIALYSFFSAATVVVALLCLGLFYYLVLIYSGETTLNVFMFEIPKAGGAAIFVDEATALSSANPDQTKAIMGECAEKIASSLSPYKPNVYYIRDGECRTGGQAFNYTDCDKKFSELPVIYVRYGEKSVSFRTLYSVNASYQGGDEWLKDCHLANAIR
ncbi:MAG: hypothetical protein V1909_06805 [Candidatus Micrarchaeota archaeon]